MKPYYLILVLIFFQSCYGVNEETSEICFLNTTCLTPEAWNQIKIEYSVEGIIDSALIEKLSQFKHEPFEVEVYYFKDYPEEFIGISIDHNAIRYVYNKNIDDSILDGFSSSLNNSEKMRIRKRFQSILIKYQCEKGKIESKNLINEEI
jgi:hypothetical protein